VTYNVKHNQMNGEGNRDGNNNNYSFNHGAEGEVSDVAINIQRRRAERNMMATLMLSAGIPMVTAGDEVSKTQLGNNNAYCQDSTLSWVNWNLHPHQQELKQTFAYLSRMRRENGSLRQPNFGNFEEALVGSDMVKWFSESGQILTEDQWNNAQQRTIMRLVSHINTDGSLNTTLLVIHGAETEIEITLPETAHDWHVLWDSSKDVPPAKTQKLKAEARVKMGPTSMLLLRAD
jgi:glycogen debranching enzyme